MFWQIFISLAAMIPACAITAVILFRVRQYDKDPRRDPITTELTNLPGASLQAQREEFGKDMLVNLAMSFCVGFVCTIPILARRVTGDLSTWNWIDTLCIGATIAGGVYYGLQMTKDIPRMRQLRQGQRAEQATAQEMAASLAGQNRIIHDIQAGEFNIDHVVITPAGVFAVETKSRQKPAAGSGVAGVKVRYDGKRLEFPGWSETEPVEQAARQATWLAKHLKKSTGEDFPVFAVLSLPGWYIDAPKALSEDMVRVINPKNCRWLLLPDKAPRLDAGGIQRAAFAIEKLAQIQDESRR